MLVLQACKIKGDRITKVMLELEGEETIREKRYSVISIDEMLAE